jgi:hypothetical protein
MQQGEQLLLHFASSLVSIVQLRKNWCHNQPLLGLSHVFLGTGLLQPKLYETIQLLLLDLVGYLLNQHRGHILQHHGMQRKAGIALSALDQRAPTQAIHRFKHLDAR